MVWGRCKLQEKQTISTKYATFSSQSVDIVLSWRLTFWVLYDATDVVAGAVGGDRGQSDLVGERDSQVGYGVREQHALLWLFASQVYLLPQ